MKYQGYTLVEILISITIVGLLVTAGLSGYTKSQERQTILIVKEQIMTVLQEAQTQAKIGENNCTGVFQGIEVTLVNSDITKTPKCSGGNGTSQQTIIPSITFSGTYALTFQPLGNGVNLGGLSSLNINYLLNSNNYQINVTSPGIIMYNGKI